MNRNKCYLIGELIVMLVTLFFIFKLNSYNKILHDIQSIYNNKIQQTLEVAKEPNYFNYLILGFIFILLLVGYTILIFKARIGNEFWIIMLMNSILLIALLIVFWNPVLATFATLLIVITLCILS